MNYLNENPLMLVATCEGDQPRVRPFTAKAEFEGKLYIGTNNKKDVYNQMIANPKVEICVSGAKGTWMRIVANVTEDMRREARVAMMEANPGLDKMYHVDDNLFTVFYLTDGIATLYSFAGEPVQYKF
jgi:uncharacterized pyridoxamine 5'-phosphate oxidase family protein